MALQLLVHKTNETDEKPDSFVFQQERITIGRDSVNDLFLDDANRIVSKHHAEIITSGATIHLMDLGSKNFTYLNGERLSAGHPYPVETRDTIQIGEFKIILEVDDTKRVPLPSGANGDKTVFDARFINPFEDSAKLLAVALCSLSKLYDEEVPNRRDDALGQALSAAMEGDIDHKAFQVVARELAPEAAASPPPPAAPYPSQPVVPPMLPAVGARIHHLVDSLLQSITRLIEAPWQFRYEFMEQTIMQPEAAAFLNGEDAASLKHRLLDPSLSDEEAAKRMHLLSKAVGDVEVHQVAMLEGYIAGVREGSMHLIDQLHPDALVQEVAQSKLLYRLLPSLAKAKALQRLREQLLELRATNWAVVEKNIYRPAFIKAYLDRVTATRRQEPYS